MTWIHADSVILEVKMGISVRGKLPAHTHHASLAGIAYRILQQVAVNGIYETLIGLYAELLGNQILQLHRALLQIRSQLLRNQLADASEPQICCGETLRGILHLGNQGNVPYHVRQAYALPVGPVDKGALLFIRQPWVVLERFQIGPDARHRGAKFVGDVVCHLLLLLLQLEVRLRVETLGDEQEKRQRSGEKQEYGQQHQPVGMQEAAFGHLERHCRADYVLPAAARIIDVVGAAGGRGAYGTGGRLPSQQFLDLRALDVVLHRGGVVVRVVEHLPQAVQDSHPYATRQQSETGQGIRGGSQHVGIALKPGAQDGFLVIALAQHLHRKQGQGEDGKDGAHPYPQLPSHRTRNCSRSRPG